MLLSIAILYCFVPCLSNDVSHSVLHWYYLLTHSLLAVMIGMFLRHYLALIGIEEPTGRFQSTALYHR